MADFIQSYDASSHVALSALILTATLSVDGVWHGVQWSREIQNSSWSDAMSNDWRLWEFGNSICSKCSIYCCHKLVDSILCKLSNCDQCESSNCSWLVPKVTVPGVSTEADPEACLQHCQQSISPSCSQGRLDKASLYPWTLPSWCWIEMSYSDKRFSHLPCWPMGSGVFIRYVRAAWSVQTTMGHPNRCRQYFFSLYTKPRSSLRVIQYNTFLRATRHLWRTQWHATDHFVPAGAQLQKQCQCTSVQNVSTLVTWCH